MYVSPSQIRKFNLKTGDIIKGRAKRNNPTDKFAALLFIENIDGYRPEEAARRKNFEDLTRFSRMSASDWSGRAVRWPCGSWI